MAYDVYLLCELYLLSLKIFIFVSFKINELNKRKTKGLQLNCKSLEGTELSPLYQALRWPVHVAVCDSNTQ